MKIVKIAGIIVLGSALSACHHHYQREHSVYFDTGSYQLSKAENVQLSNIADNYLSEYQQNLRPVHMVDRKTIHVIGYTDATGSKEINKTLAQQRADTVRDALILAGVHPANITTMSKPECRNKAKVANAKMRRTDIGVF